MRSMAAGGGAGEGEEQAVVRVAALARERPSVSPRNRLFRFSSRPDSRLFSRSVSFSPCLLLLPDCALALSPSV